MNTHCKLMPRSSASGLASKITSNSCYFTYIRILADLLRGGFNHISQKYIVSFVLLFILIFCFKEISAGTSSEGYDYSHRKRDCEIRVITPEGEPLVALVGIGQISNDFVFGGTIHKDAFDTLGDKYGDWFRNYFDGASPGVEMTWEHTMNCSEKCDPDFSKADSLVDWLLGNDILIHARNLFSNENEERIPTWTRNLEPDAFKQAIKERIETAMGHFKGKVSYWDLISEICHGEDGSFLSSGMLETKSGDPDIFSWIMDEARKNDPEADFIINDYNLITSGDSTAASQYIDKVKPLSNKFEIIGASGHFGANMDKSSYEPNINYLAKQLGKTVWLTDVNFAIDSSLAPDKLEELMRSSFANPNVGGLIMGSWCSRYMSRSGLTSYFIDSLNNETPAGERWREVRDEWQTEVSGPTDDSGKISFTGFHGKYVVLVSCYTDTFYLEPGENTKTVVVTHMGEAAVDYTLAGLKTTEIIINGIAAPIKLPTRYNKQLFLATYSLSGQQLSRSPVNPAGRNLVTPAASCCRVFRIETTDQLPLYTGKITAAR